MDKPDPQEPQTEEATADTPATAEAKPEAEKTPRADAFGNTGAQADGGVFPQLDTEDSRNALAPRPEPGSTGINAMLNVCLLSPSDAADD